MRIRSLALRTLTIPAVARALRPVVRPAVPIFMAHRFANPDLGTRGHDASALRAHLAYLRRERFQLISLQDLVADALPDNGRRPRIAFTVDDGYTDFVDIALPAFAEHDCPVSVFVSTGVLDTGSWYWPDKINFAFGATRASRITVDVGDRPIELAWSSTASRDEATERLIQALTLVDPSVRSDVIVRVADMLEVAPPPLPPASYASMSWDDVRRVVRTGLVTVGPHSVTHPSLPSLSDATSRHEILDSWRRLKEVIPAALPVFCYPFGAYTAREVEILAASDMQGAVTTEFRYSRLGAFAPSAGPRRFTTPRVGYDDDRLQFLQTVSGLERIKLGVRLGQRGWGTAGAPPNETVLATR